MKNFAQAIFAAEAISTKAQKFALLSGFGPDEKKLLNYTFNPFLVYGIRKYDAAAAYATVDAPYSIFFALLDKLANRDLTGGSAKAAVTATLSQYTEETAKVLARVLNKDLDCGANRDSFEKIYTDLGIPRFDVMLAAKIEEKAVKQKPNDVVLTEEILLKKYGLNIAKDGMIAESKYDGTRLIAIVNQGDIKYFSRGGKPSDHCTGLFDDELIAVEKIVGQPFILDGEALANSFQETLNAKGSGGDAAKANLKFRAFDIMTLTDWTNQDCDLDQTQRSTWLYEILSLIGAKKLIKSKSKVCHSIAELRDFYAEVLAEGTNPDGTLNGLGEGLIIKNPNGLYQWERSSNWFKWKPVINLDLKLVGWEKGKGRLANTVGKLLLDGTDENGTRVVARCGSGLNDKDRAFFLANVERLVAEGNTIIEIEAQELSLADGATVHSARFPIFIRIRDDK